MIEDGSATGYTAREYAEAFRYEGQPLPLRDSGAWLVRRAVPGHPSRFDAASCYPLLCCLDWSRLGSDLARFEAEHIVSVVAVIDPLADPLDLEVAFPDLLRPFKQHYVVDLHAYHEKSLSQHHRRNVAKGRRSCEVTIVGPPRAAARDWVGLYAELTRRHDIVGRAAFPAEALVAQLEVPGTTVFRARVDGETVGMLVWMESGGNAYYHLGAFTPTGYAARASYAMFDHALRHFGATARFALLGGGAGVDAGDDDDGLVRFKRGWGSFARPAMIGGRIVDRETYDRLASVPGAAGSTFFPAYRPPGLEQMDRPT